MRQTSLYLKVEAQPGVSIGTAITDALLVASKLELTVEFLFNGVTVLVNPDTNPDLLLKRYDVMVSSDKEYKIIS